MFDQKSGNGQVSGGDKESAMTSAGETMMKVSFMWSSVPTGYGGTRWERATFEQVCYKHFRSVGSAGNNQTENLERKSIVGKGLRVTPGSHSVN